MTDTALCKDTTMNTKLHPVLSVRVFGAEKCFGPGLAELLRRVEEHRSLRAAAASMGMAYSKAWTILKQSEKSLGFALLHSSTGGKNGGGAVLTPEAEKLLLAFEDYCGKLNACAETLFRESFADFL